MRQAKGYLASQLGFSITGRYVLDNLIKPRIIGMGIRINDPFEECGKIFPQYLDTITDYEDRKRRLDKFNLAVNSTNERLMQDSDVFLGILDGGQSVGEGVASEIGYYSAIKRGPIIALKSDIRPGENMAISIDAQLFGYIIANGQLIDGPNAVERWFEEIQKWHESFK